MSNRIITGIVLMILGVALLVLGLGPWDLFQTDFPEIPLIVLGAVSTGVGAYKLFAPEGVRRRP